VHRYLQNNAHPGTDVGPSEILNIGVRFQRSRALENQQNGGALVQRSAIPLFDDLAGQG
jgi:hypothetical protein